MSEKLAKSIVLRQYKTQQNKIFVFVYNLHFFFFLLGFSLQTLKKISLIHAVQPHWLWKTRIIWCKLPYYMQAGEQDSNLQW